MMLITLYNFNYGVLIRSNVFNAIDVKLTLIRSGVFMRFYDVNITTIEYFNYLL